MIRTILKEYGIKPNKSLGQNFLNDDFALDSILEEINPLREDRILEIGAGTGVLTERLAPKVREITAVEIDKNLIPPLLKLASEHGNIRVVNRDFLKLTGEEIYGIGSREVKVVGNLPYYISTPILMKVIGNWRIFGNGVFMVQREFSEKINARPKTKAYGPLTILLNCYYNPEVRFFLEPESFYPRPAVSSAVIKLNKKDNNVIDDVFFMDFVKRAFTQKRKTLLNSLGMDRKYMGDILSRLNIKPDARPQEIDPDTYIRLCNLVYEGRGGT